MSAALTFPTAAFQVRDVFAESEFRRRATGYGFALILHALALAALLILPPAFIPTVEGGGEAIEVRIYTVAGGPDAESDAPLFEPPLAGGQAQSGDATGQTGGDGETRSDEVETPIIEDVDPGPSPEEETDPVERPEETPVEITPPPDAVLTTPQQNADTPSVAPPVTTAPLPTPAPPPVQSTPDPTISNQPVATLQPDPNPPPAPVRRRAPTFADIVARAESRLAPEDFDIVVNFAGGVRGTVRETFCLSSSDANQETFDCPEGSQLAAPELARYGLMGLGERPPEFLEDMDRLEFQLAQAGMNDTQIGRILTVLRESRREVLNTPDIERSMSRDERDRTDNLGVGGFPNGG